MATLFRCAGPCIGDFGLSCGGVWEGMSHAHVGLSCFLFSECICGCDVGSIGGWFVIEEGFSVPVDNGGTGVASGGLAVWISASMVGVGGGVRSGC